MYKLGKNPTGEIVCVRIIDGQNITTIPFNSDNTDYANFKKKILAETAELQDADGNTMSAVEAKEFVATLP